MSYIQPTISCCLNSTFNEHQWIMQIRRILDIEDEDDNDIHISIFNVPKSLMATNPNAYTPQLVAIGPYHFWRPELQEMERYKLSSAKRIQNQNQHIKLQIIVDRLLILEPKIRACYHKYLDINGETLAWMMAIDASFLLEVISIYSIKEGKVFTRVLSRMSHLVDYARIKSGHNAILRDITMLENQIPLFVLREILEFQFPSSNLVEENFISILIGLYKVLSPFKMVEDFPRIQSSRYEHLLDFLYHILVPKLEETIEISEPINEATIEERRVCKLLSQLKECLSQILPRIMFILPWVFICNNPAFTIFKTLFFPEKNHQENLENGTQSTSNQDDKPLLVEEIMIPSVVELSESGVTFLPTNGGIIDINFDVTKKKFYLPTIGLDVNSEILLRNLVAYEASNVLGPLVFTRYTELMNGIIDTKDDVRLLRERGIILNYLKSDQEVADLWNGMTKSLKLTRVPFLDEVIENVNKYYEGNWKVKVSKFIKVYMTNSWQFLAFLTNISSILLCFVLFSYFGTLVRK